MDLPADRPVPRWLHVLAVYTVVHAAVLLILGAFVSSFRVGMADPVWPTEPWYLASNFKFDFGYLVEHFHRIVGWSIALPGLLLTFGMWVREPRFGLRWFGVGALIALVVTFSTFQAVLRKATVGQEGWLVYLNLVAMGLSLAVVWGTARLTCDGSLDGLIRTLAVLGMTAAMVQGLLGGVRVRYDQLAGRELSAIHGVVAQVVFVLLIAVAALTRKPKAGPTVPDGLAITLQWQTLALVLFTFGQVIWGAWIRHFPGPLANRLHLFFAFLVVGFATVVLKQALSDPATRERFRVPAGWLMTLLTVQVVLGIEAWLGKFLTGTLPELERITPGTAFLRTAHAHVGAWVLAVTVLLVIAARRNPAGGVGPRQPASVNSQQTPSPEPALVAR